MDKNFSILSALFIFIGIPLLIWLFDIISSPFIPETPKGYNGPRYNVVETLVPEK